MELYTMNSRYAALSEIDSFSTAIWTERFAGDADFQITASATPDILRKLAVGTRVGLVGSREVMMVDKQSVKSKILTVNGTSLTQKLNHRFIRFDRYHGTKSWPITDSPGVIMKNLVQNMAIDSSMLDDPATMGVSDPAILKIPDLYIGAYDDTMDAVSMAVPYGPLFDALKAIAQAYVIGQRLVRFGVADLRYVNWLPVDHTSDSPNALVRFSPQLDNFGDTTEVVDATNFKTHVFVYGDQLPDSITGGTTVIDYIAGEDSVEGAYTGFDLRAELVFDSDITNIYLPEQVKQYLDVRAFQTLQDSRIVSAIDGTIQPVSEYVYGNHYNLGDLVETQGTLGIIQKSRVTEYIRAQDSSGEKAYPTLIAA